jgi:hypothetical protein
MRPGDHGQNRIQGARERLRAFLGGQAEALTQKAVEAALGGDSIALRLCLDRVIPARKERFVTWRRIKPMAASFNNHMLRGGPQCRKSCGCFWLAVLAFTGRKHRLACLMIARM